MKLPNIWLIAAFVTFLAGFLYGQFTPTPIPPNPGGIANGVLLGDPRTPISYLPFTIDRRGSYYLVKSLVGGGGGQSGITVRADDVTIDLNGFSLTGAAPSASGIIVVGNHRNLRVYNGTITGWGLHGIEAASSSNSDFRNLFVIDNSMAAPQRLGINGGENTTITNCHGIGNGSGFFLGANGIISDCVARSNKENGISLSSNCLALNNNCGDNGTNISNGSGIVANGSGCTVEGNVVSMNDFGIRTNSGRNLVIRNRAHANTTDFSDISGGNAFGQIIDVKAGSTGIVNSDPTANFRY